jgi:hypothetical protein
VPAPGLPPQSAALTALSPLSAPSRDVSRLGLRRPALSLTALFALALGLRLLLVPADGNVSDITGLVLFGAQVAAHGPHALYDAPEILRPYYVIPPVFPFLLGATYWAWGHLTGAGSALGVAQFPGVPEYSLAASFVKLWAIAGDLVLGGIIYAWVSHHVGLRWGLICAAAYLLNPGVVYDSAWWGQVESLLVLCVALSLTALLRGSPAQSGLWLALGLGVKPQVIVAFPIVGMLMLATVGLRGLARFASAGGATVVLFTAPFWATGRFGSLIGNYAGATGIHPQVSVNAYNFWMAVGGPPAVLASVSDLAFALPGLTFRNAGFILLIAYTAIVGVCVLSPRRVLASLRSIAQSAPPTGHLLDPDFWLLAAAALYCAFFMLPTQIHERYLYPGVALLSLTLARRPLMLALYGALSLGFFVNLIRVVPWDPGVQASLDALGFTAWRIALSNVIAFSGLTCLLLASCATGNRAEVISRRVLLAISTSGAILLAIYAILAQIVPAPRFQPALADVWLIALASLVVGCGAVMADAVEARKQRGTIAPWISRGVSPL